MQNLNTPLIVRGRLIENSAPNFTIAPSIFLSARTTSLSHFFQQVQSDGLCVVALAISIAVLQLDGNQTDSCTLKGGLDKATT